MPKTLQTILHFPTWLRAALGGLGLRRDHGLADRFMWQSKECGHTLMSLKIPFSGDHLVVETIQPMHFSYTLIHASSRGGAAEETGWGSFIGKHFMHFSHLEKPPYSLYPTVSPIHPREPEGTCDTENEKPGPFVPSLMFYGLAKSLPAGPTTRIWSL